MNTKNLIVGYFSVVLVCTLLACGANSHLVIPSSVPEAPLRVTDNVIERAESLYLKGDCEEAVKMLRVLGEQEYSYYRMDEALYWMAKCREKMGDAVRADRAISMLRSIYPRCESSFPDLGDLQREVEYALASRNGEVDSVVHSKGARSSPAVDSSVERRESADLQPTVTNVFYETDIRQALTDISAQTGISIVPDNYISGFVTVEFENTPLEDALDQLLTPMGFSYRKMENYYFVGSPSTENPSFVFLSETEEIRPRYISCENAKKLLPALYEKYLRLNATTNSLTITAPRSIINKFKEDLEKVDRPQTQIMIEAMVVEMSSEVGRSLGIEWNWLNRDGDKNYQVRKLAPSGSDSTFIAKFSRIKSAFDLNLTFRALATQGKAKIRANPRVATLDGNQAEIRIAKEVYFSLVQGSVNFPYFTLEKIPTGITLKITPRIGDSSEITIDIVTEVSDVIGSSLNDLPVTNVRTVSTRIRVMNGETIAIGGLIADRETKETNRVPLLGDIPILGLLFGHTSVVKEQSEIVILIIPHILINPMEFGML